MYKYHVAYSITNILKSKFAYPKIKNLTIHLIVWGIKIMGKEKYSTFTQESLTSETSKADIAGGVCLGYCIEFIKYFKKYGTSDSIAKGFGFKEGSDLGESLLDMGEKSISTHYSSGGDVYDLFGKKSTLEKLGFTVTVGKDTGADKDKTVSEIKSSGRFTFHIIYFDVYKDSFSKAGWHVVVLKETDGKGLDLTGYFIPWIRTRDSGEYQVQNPLVTGCGVILKQSIIRLIWLCTQ